MSFIERVFPILFIAKESSQIGELKAGTGERRGLNMWFYRKREFSDRRIERALYCEDYEAGREIAKESSQIGELKGTFPISPISGILSDRKREFSDRRIESYRRGIILEGQFKIAKESSQIGELKVYVV